MDQSPVEVQDNLGRKVRAKMLIDAAGRHVRDPMTNMPVIVDEDFDIDRAIAFGRMHWRQCILRFAKVARWICNAAIMEG